MKITKRQLKRIIKEEKARLLREQMDPASAGSMAVAADAYAEAQGGLRTFEFTVTLRGDGLDEAEACHAFADNPGDPDPTLTYQVD
tara:strand:- start:171 stop:428 length:258 start_codon:yes stop_codon:yes gene_type:complete